MFQLDGQPVCYRNAKELDILDDTDLNVDINTWRSSEMGLPDLFEPAEYPSGPNIGLTFAAYLFRQFFSQSHFNQFVSYRLVQLCCWLDQLASG